VESGEDDDPKRGVMPSRKGGEKNEDKKNGGRGEPLPGVEKKKRENRVANQKQTSFLQHERGARAVKEKKKDFRNYSLGKKGGPRSQNKDSPRARTELRRKGGKRGKIWGLGAGKSIKQKKGVRGRGIKKNPGLSGGHRVREVRDTSKNLDKENNVQTSYKLVNWKLAENRGALEVRELGWNKGLGGGTRPGFWGRGTGGRCLRSKKMPSGRFFLLSAGLGKKGEEGRQGKMKKVKKTL